MVSSNLNPMLRSVYSYNVNGIRAAMNKGFGDWLAKAQPDILCLQETKAQPEQIDTAIFDRLGYYHYWYSAQKKGYSGVALLTKEKPDRVEYGMGIDEYDTEGRAIRADFGDISVVSMYFPSGTSGDARQAFKMIYLDRFLQWIEQLRKERPNLIISGDFNIAHKEIDINHPNRHNKMSGFLPEERAWVDQFLKHDYVDTFRMFNQQPEQYSWWSYLAQSRAKNLGWRIDYHMVTGNLKLRIAGAGILQDVVHSDHCPVTVTVDFEK